jgi:hypothetical protein
MDFRDSFIFYGDNPKTYSKAECERDAKLLFRSHLHSSHDSDQHLCFKMAKTISIKSILRMTVQEVLSFFSEVVFIALITVINICFPILRLNVKEKLSFYSEAIFIVLITVINICFSKE